MLTNPIAEAPLPAFDRVLKIESFVQSFEHCLRFARNPLGLNLLEAMLCFHVGQHVLDEVSLVVLREPQRGRVRPTSVQTETSIGVGLVPDHLAPSGDLIEFARLEHLHQFFAGACQKPGVRGMLFAVQSVANDDRVTVLPEMNGPGQQV